MKIPCIDCITFSVCNAYLSPLLDFTETGIILKLYDKCSLMRDYVNTNQIEKSIEALEIEYKELEFDYHAITKVFDFFKQFKERNDD